MARIRTIKPEFWTDEDLSALSAEDHLFAAALLNHCDDEGFFKANPRLLHAQIFALRDLSGTVPVFVQNLKNIGYLRTFQGSDGKEYGEVINFNKHQSINKAKPSKIKPLELIRDTSGTDTGRIPVGKEQGTGNREHESTTTSAEQNFHDQFIKKTENVCGNSQDDHPVWNWEPSQNVYQSLKKQRVPEEFINEQILSFKTYRSGLQDGYQNFDAKFLDSVLGSWRRIGHNWTPPPEYQELEPEDKYAGFTITEDAEGNPL